MKTVLIDDSPTNSTIYSDRPQACKHAGNQTIVIEAGSTDKKLVWDPIETFVQTHPNGNYFQSTHAFDVYSRAHNYRPLMLVSYDERCALDGVLLAVVQREGGFIKGAFSSRCLVVGGPLVNASRPAVAETLVNKLLHEIRGASIYVEFRQLFVGNSLNHIFQARGLERLEYYNYIVPTNDSDGIRKRLHQNRRRQIDRSFKEGARIVVADRIEQVREFYRILSSLYRTKVKKPLPPLEVFENFFYDTSSGKYFLVEFRDRIIGGAACPIYKQTIYEWYICGLDGEYKTVYPSVLATWAPIEYGANNGLTNFDFMGAGPADKEYGVRQFKERFGGDLVPYNRFIEVNNRLLYEIGKVGLRMYSLFR